MPENNNCTDPNKAVYSRVENFLKKNKRTYTIIRNLRVVKYGICTCIQGENNQHLDEASI